jgi:hypothetical protein
MAPAVIQSIDRQIRRFFHWRVYSKNRPFAFLTFMLGREAPQRSCIRLQSMSVPGVAEIVVKPIRGSARKPSPIAVRKIKLDSAVISPHSA